MAASMFDNILIVCIGNICRSPICSGILADSFPSKKIWSAGLGAMVGHGVDEKMYRIAFEKGIDVKNHVARQVTQEDCYQADLILVMEKDHLKKVTNISPLSKGKIFLFGHWQDDIEIHDPYKMSDEFYESVFNAIQLAALSWIKFLKN